MLLKYKVTKKRFGVQWWFSAFWLRSSVVDNELHARNPWLLEGLSCMFSCFGQWKANKWAVEHSWETCTKGNHSFLLGLSVHDDPINTCGVGYIYWKGKKSLSINYHQRLGFSLSFHAPLQGKPLVSRVAIDLLTRQDFKVLKGKKTLVHRQRELLFLLVFTWFCWPSL